MIKVCDAVMGTGKSSAAITYINEHPEKKFIYITPYLEEAKRIKDACPNAHFVEPSNADDEYDHKKLVHSAALIHKGFNITSTHQAFKGYTHDMLTDVRRNGYTLIIDESVDVLEQFNVNPDDLQMVIDAGYIKEDNGAFSIIKDDYKGNAFRDLFNMLKSRELVRIKRRSDSLFYWVLPPELVMAFDDVFILTYLFEGQSIHHFLEIYNIQYEFIGIDHTDGVFRFCDGPGYTPEYVSNLRNMIHILDNDKLNSIGDGTYSLSMNWFKTPENVEKLKKNMYNCFRNVWGDCAADKRMWGAYSDAEYKLRGKGYSNAFIVFNQRAVNGYRDKNHLIYPINIFMNVEEKKFYAMHGVDVDEDLYALSIMIQWIWRSEIRDGSEIYIYVPSKRMRTLLINWIDSVSKGGSENA